MSKVNSFSKFLNYLYTTAGILAACSLVAMMLLILGQIVFRQFNSHIPSSGDMIGFLVVWTSFFSLAYTMHYQQHIRVELFVGRLSRSPRRWFNIAVGIVALVMMVTFSYYVLALIYESFKFQDKTDGEIAMPLWLIQLPMGIGCVLFTLSLVDFTLQQIVQNEHDKFSVKD